MKIFETVRNMVCLKCIFAKTAKKLFVQTAVFYLHRYICRNLASNSLIRKAESNEREIYYAMKKGVFQAMFYDCKMFKNSSYDKVDNEFLCSLLIGYRYEEG